MDGIQTRLTTALGALLLAAAVAMAVAAGSALAAEEAAWLYDPDTVVEIDLGLSPEAIDALEAEPDEYVNGSFTVKVGGVVKGPALAEVGIRLKGGLGSFRKLSEKAAFKIKFAEFVPKQKYYGLKKLTLNNMVQDPSMVHETLAYDLFRAMGVPAPRTGYAFTRLNGEVIGVQADIETYDDVSLPRMFDATQHLYEADTPGVDVVPGGAGEFEVDEGDDEDLGDLEALIAAANDDEGDWSEGMAATADLEEMTRMWAVERYVGHWDGYAGVAGAFRPNNYYLHSDDVGLFEMLPWGTDQTWDDEVEFDEPAGGLLFNECRADASCHALYDQALEGVQDLVPTLELRSKAERYAELLAPCQALESEPRREYSEEEIADGVEDAIDFIESRPTALSDYLGQPSPPLPPDGPGPATEEPCSPRPEPPADPGAPGGGAGGTGSPPVPALGLSFGPTRADGNRISTRLTAPSAGTASQSVRIKMGGDWRLACRGTKAVAGAGPLIVGCRLARWARDLRHDGSLRLRVRVGFGVAGGAGGIDTRHLTLPAHR